MRGERIAERALERLAFDEELQERQAVQALRAGGEQVFGGGIGVAHDEVLVERHDRRGEQLESRELGAGDQKFPSGRGCSTHA